jgi:hypothetical protein
MTQDSSNQDPFEFIKRLWAPMGLPMPGLMTPTLNVSEVEKRIADLKSVENWLTMNLNMLRMTIQGLEMQKATLSAMQSMQQAASDMARPPGAAPAATPPVNPAASAAEAWWSMLQASTQAAGAGAEAKPDKKGK